jgi:hypothetical protein
VDIYHQIIAKAFQRSGDLPWTKFQPYPFQSELLDNFRSGKSFIIWSARQMGISLISKVFLLEKLASDTQHAAYVTFNLYAAVRWLASFRAMHAHNRGKQWMRSVLGFDSELLPAVSRSSKFHLIFDNGSSIRVMTPNSNLRGLLNPNATLFLEGSDFRQELLDVVSQRIICHTGGARSMGFKRTWSAASGGTNDITPIKLPYNLHPHRDEAWVTRNKELMTPDRFEAEFLCAD